MPEPSPVVVGVAPLAAGVSDGLPIHHQLWRAVSIALVASCAIALLNGVTNAIEYNWLWVNWRWHAGELGIELISGTAFLSGFVLFSDRTKTLSRARASLYWLALVVAYVLLLAPAFTGLQLSLLNAIYSGISGVNSAPPTDVAWLTVWADVAASYERHLNNPANVLWTFLSPGIPLLVLAGVRSILRWPGWAQILALTAGHILAGASCGALLGHLQYPGQPWGEFALSLSVLGIMYWTPLPLALGLGESATARLAPLLARLRMRFSDSFLGSALPV